MILGHRFPVTLIVASTLCLLAGQTSRAANSVAYETRRVHGVSAHVVTVNLNDPRVRVTVSTASRGIGHSEPFGAFVRRTTPVAAITGTFFDTRSLVPVGDIVSKGHTVYRGPAGTAFCVTSENNVEFRPRRWGRTYDWSGFDTVLCTGPTLIREGRNVLSPHDEGYRDPALWALRPRTAVGVTKYHKLLMVCVNKPIHLGDMVKIMKALGAKEAVGLDGGSSSALYCTGQYAVRPSRSLTNLLAVYRDKEAPTVIAAIHNVTKPRPTGAR